MTEARQATKKTAAKKPANAPVDRDKVRAAAEKEGEKFEAQRQERIEANTPVEPDPDNPAFWRWLARPFGAEDQEKLPKGLTRSDDKGPCEDTPRGRKYSADGHYCGGWHSRSIHLDYIGHAGITMRLNEDVGANNWSWRPMALGENGLPAMSRDEFWIVLEILGVEKYGVGDDFKGSAKQAISDALRNAAMRFGLGTYLWAKSEKAFNMKANTEQAQETPAEHTRQAEEAGPAPHILRFREQWDALTAEAKKEVWKDWQKAGFPNDPSALSESQVTVAEGWIEKVVEAQAKATLGDRLGAQETGEEPPSE